MSSLEITVSEATKEIAEKIMEQAKKQRESIIQEAMKTSERMRNEARDELNKKKQKLLEEGKREIDNLKDQELVKIKMEYKKKIFLIQWSLVDDIIFGAISIAERIRDNEEKYKKYIKTRIKNALNIFKNEKVIVHIDKRDIDLVKGVLEELGEKENVKIIPDITTVGGLIFTSEDGMKELNETIEFRLKLNQNSIKEKVYNFLFGDIKIGI